MWAKPKGFTIVELLIVIIVIAILAAITVIAFNGVQNRARASSLQSEASQAARQLRVFQSDETARYPATVSTNCTTQPDSSTNKCLKLGPDVIVLSYNSPSPNSTFRLTISDAGSSMWYEITESSGPTLVSGAGFSGTTVTGQVWSPTNLNVGTMIPGNTNQTNNSIVEKYCYGDLESNCSTYGALYQWNEAMKYSTAEGVQGICPPGTHIPSDADWKTLEMALGMSQADADATGWRSVEGTKLKPGGSSGLNIPLAGYRFTDMTFGQMGSIGYLWTSTNTAASTSAARYVHTSLSSVARVTAQNKSIGQAIRCLKD